jgi:hypothetical protein
MTTLLAKYLSTLSTSAPAPSCSVGPSVFRQGTCDRGIWRKPVAFAADAGGAYGICFGVSKFVRVHDERMGSVSKRDWSLWGKWSGIGGGFLVRVEGRSGWAATSRDTTSIRAKALAGESGMGSGSGRVKGGTPDRELGKRPWRESFHDEHGNGAVWTTEATGLGGRGMSQCGGMRFWVVQQQTMTAG